MALSAQIAFENYCAPRLKSPAGAAVAIVPLGCKSPDSKGQPLLLHYH